MLPLGVATRRIHAGHFPQNSYRNNAKKKNEHGFRVEYAYEEKTGPPVEEGAAEGAILGQ